MMTKPCQPKFSKHNLYLDEFKTKNGTWFVFSNKMKEFDRPINLGCSSSYLEVERGEDSRFHWDNFREAALTLSSHATKKTKSVKKALMVFVVGISKTVQFHKILSTSQKT